MAIFAHKNKYNVRKEFLRGFHYFASFVSLIIVLFNLSIYAICFIPILYLFSFVLFYNFMYLTHGEPEFIFDNHKIYDIHRPSTILDETFTILIQNRLIMNINENEYSHKVHISYAFDLVDSKTGRFEYGTTNSISYHQDTTIQQYIQRSFNITITNNSNIDIYNKDLEYFETMYFKNPNKTIITNLNEFIKLSINDAIYKLLRYNII